MHHLRWKRPALILGTALAVMAPISAITTAEASPAAAVNEQPSAAAMKRRQMERPIMVCPR